MISVELAGQNIPPTVQLVPDIIRAIAAHVLDACVMSEGGIGGFATEYLRYLHTFVLGSITPAIDRGPYSTALRKLQRMQLLL